MTGAHPWQQYQEDVAKLLAELGFAAQVEDQLTSLRGVTHKVDVAARRIVAGVEVLWVVECKLWRSRVSKEKVAALAAICDDLGADRGLLMSETGFQSGALQMAAGRNITLTSLEDLHANAAADLQFARQNQIEHRLKSIETVLREMKTTSVGENFGYFIVKPIYLLGLSRDEHARRAEEAEARFTIQDVLAVAGRTHEERLEPSQDVGADRRRAKRSVEGRVKRLLEMSVTSGADQVEVDALLKIIGKCRTTLNEGVLGQWPVLVEDRDGEWRTAWSMRQLLNVLEPVLNVLEKRSHAQRRRVEAQPNGTR